MGSVNARLLDEAAHWLARRHASDFSEKEQLALLRWRRQSPEHEDIWLRAEQLSLRMGSIPSAVGMAVLDRPRPARGRRQILRAAALALATPALGWLSYRHMPWQTWSADYRTATGQARAVMLADGSRVQLNTASAISTRFTGNARRIRQYAGEILVETSHTAGYPAPPFIVQTADGQMRALGTRFTVRKHDQGTALSVFQGSVQVAPENASSSVVVHAGEQLRFDRQGAGPVSPLAPQADAWVQGVLYAENLRLKDFLAELGRYREGMLLCDPSAADLRVSGVYQLRDTDRVLELLTQTLPVHTLTRTRFWVTVTHS